MSTSVNYVLPRWLSGPYLYESEMQQQSCQVHHLDNKVTYCITWRHIFFIVKLYIKRNYTDTWFYTKFKLNAYLIFLRNIRYKWGWEVFHCWSTIWRNATKTEGYEGKYVLPHINIYWQKQ